MSTYKETIVISMGGSLLIPEEIDLDFIRSLKTLVKKITSDGYQIALVIGGGKTCRKYQKAASHFDVVNNEDLDWIGIKTIHLNCELLHRSFKDLDIHENIILKHEDISTIKESLIIIGAWEPGYSSDYDAVQMAEVLGAQKIVNFSNVSHVYDSDPRENPNAQKKEKLLWDEYRSLIPETWSAGLSAPFDPIASREAQKLGMHVAVLGASLENLEAYLNGEAFEGSIISDSSNEDVK